MVAFWVEVDEHDEAIADTDVIAGIGDAVNMARSAYFTDTSANTDLLAGSNLDGLGPGTYCVYAVSSVTTCTLTATSEGIVKINAAAVVVDADGTEVRPDINRDYPYKFRHSGTGRPTIAIGGTTGTWTALVVAEDVDIP